MTKRMISVLFLLSLCVLLLPLAASAPPTNPTTQVSSTTLELEYPKFYYLKQSADHRFHVHVINQTALKTNKTTSCIFHLYNSSGHDIQSVPSYMGFEDYNGIDFAIDVGGTNFTKTGYYSYVIQCNSSSEVGFASSEFEVTPNGDGITIEHFLLEPGILLLIAIIFLVSAITFNNNRWLVKSVLYLLSVMFILLAINTSLGYITVSRSFIMMNTAFTIVVSSVSLLFIILLVYYLKSLASAMKQSKREQKEDLL